MKVRIEFDTDDPMSGDVWHDEEKQDFCDMQLRISLDRAFDYRVNKWNVPVTFEDYVDAMNRHSRECRKLGAKL